MSVSKTSLCNKALTICGAAPISSFSEDTNNARIINRVYDIARQSILCECNWGFATTRATLAISADSVAWLSSDETYVYDRPSDALIIFGKNIKNAVLREEGDYLISDCADLGIKYIYDIDDPTKYPAYFVEAFIDKLCSDICFMILNSTTRAEAFLAKYEKVSKPNAMSRNSQGSTAEEMIDDEWVNSKFGNAAGGNPARSYS